MTVRLDHFEGPLDLLLFLIQSHELDVSKISITKVTDQYLAYVKLMQELNFDLASEFLVMAATLIHWKSKAILPQEEQPADQENELDGVLTQEDLIRRLMEHKKFLAAGQEMARLPRLGESVFARPNIKPPTERVWKPMNISGIILSYQEILVRARKRKTVLRKETVSLSEKIIDLGERLSPGVPAAMSSLWDEFVTRPEQVVTFLASLELSRLKKMRLYQQKTYDEIYLELLESLKNFDMKLAIGMDKLETQNAQA